MPPLHCPLPLHRVPAQTAVLVKRLRGALEGLLGEKVKKPGVKLEDVGGQVSRAAAYSPPRVHYPQHPGTRPPVVHAAVDTDKVCSSSKAVLLANTSCTGPSIDRGPAKSRGGGTAVEIGTVPR